MRLEMIVPDAKLAAVVRAKLQLGFRVVAVQIEDEEQVAVAFTRTIKRPKQESLLPGGRPA